MFPKVLKKILWILLWGGLLAFPTLEASAQFDASAILRNQNNQNPNDPNNPNNMLGSNPFQTQNGEEQPAMPTDSTKKKRLRKPLESYFFNDSIRALPNFSWTISRDYNQVHINPLDTTLATFRIDYPFYKEGVGHAAVGALGQASLPYNYFERPQYRDFSFAEGFDVYTYRMENVPFYNLKRPYFHFMYLESGQKKFREENFSLTLGHNISPTTGFNVNYRSRGTKGLYEWSRTKNHNLSVAVSHTGKRYSVHAGFINNHIETRENGGVVGEWAIRDTTFEMPSGVPMRLTSSQATNIYRNNAFFVEQSYGIPLLPVTESDFSIANLPAVFIGHSFEYNSWSKVYKDVRGTYTDDRYERDDKGNFVPARDLEYYKNWFINPTQTRDSIYERVISNRVFIQAQPWDRNGVVGTVNGGVGLDLHTYSQFRLDSYLNGKYEKVGKSSYFVYGSVEGKIKKYVDWGADAKFYPSGYRGGDVSFGANLALTGYIRKRPLILEGRFRMETRSPDYWQENLFSNHYVWLTPLRKENETRFEVAFRVPDYAFEVGVWQGIVTDKIYYGADSQIAQDNGSVSVTSVYARKDFRIAGLHLDHKVLLQWSTNHRVIPVPLVSAFLSYYYEFWAVRNVLRVQFGVDGHFNTRYYAPGYNPALSEFFNQREIEVGNYPYMDLFLMGKWKRMRIFLKYQHINRDLFGNGEYFAIAKYPLNPGMFKMGISWGFYD